MICEPKSWDSLKYKNAYDAKSSAEQIKCKTKVDIIVMTGFLDTLKAAGDKKENPTFWKAGEKECVMSTVGFTGRLIMV